MKKVVFLIITCLFLTACDEVIKEETLNVVDVKFSIKMGVLDYDHIVSIETDSETLVVDEDKIEFFKSGSNETTVEATWNKFAKRKLEVRAKVYVAEKDIPIISKKYAENFRETLIFSELDESEK